MFLVPRLKPGNAQIEALPRVKKQGYDRRQSLWNSVPRQSLGTRKNGG
jgi:hypothetical protein